MGKKDIMKLSILQVPETKAILITTAKSINIFRCPSTKS
jgi:hypothetical protein